MEKIIDEAKLYIKKIFKGEYSGHDYYHSVRVFECAKMIAERERADLTVVSLAALLHDVDDIKLFPKSHHKKDNAVKFLKEQDVSDTDIFKILEIIGEVSFNGVDSVKPKSIEGQCVQDADRLDALGAIGIARAFAYGGNHNREMYNPDIPPFMGMTKEEYRKHVSTTVNHFYEKLFLLKDMMNTKIAYEIACERESFMKVFIDEFMREWNLTDF